MSAPNPKIDAFLHRATQWQDEMEALRAVLLDTGLTEELKWGKPCYTAAGGNIAIMQPFRAHLSLMFFKGVLLDDPEGILRSQGENTRSALRIELTDPEQVAALEPALRSYVAEAIAIEEAGLQVPAVGAAEQEIPEELEARFHEDEEYRVAFEALTRGRQRSYLMHFSGAQRAETRVRRIEKCRAKILEGEGFNERSKPSPTGPDGP